MNFAKHKLVQTVNIYYELHQFKPASTNEYGTK